MRDAHVLFGMGETDPRKREFLALRVEKGLYQELQAKAQAEGTTISNFTREAIKQALQ